MQKFKKLKNFSIWTSIGMFIVLLMGGAVTKTGSGEGCGIGGWPLCNGKFIPAASLESLIEYSHRFVSGVVGVMVLIVFIWVWAVLSRKDAKLYAFGALFLTVVQAALGAAAVTWPQSDLVMALHFGISLLAFAFTMLLAFVISRLDQPAREDGWGEAHHDQPAIRTRYFWLVWITLIFSYVVVYLGAYMRHADAMYGCLGWPLCNGSLIPDLGNHIVLAAFIHRIAAAILFLLIVYLVYLGIKHYRSSKLLYRVNVALLLLVTSQILSGALVVFSLQSANIHVFTGLLHSMIIAVMFGVHCYLAILTLQLGRKRQVPKS